MPEPMSDERLAEIDDLLKSTGWAKTVTGPRRWLYDATADMRAEIDRLRAAAGVEVPDPQAEPTECCAYCDHLESEHLGLGYCVFPLGASDDGDVCGCGEFERPAAGDHEGNDAPAAQYPTDAIVRAWSWFVVPDDMIGGWAIATTGEPTSQLDPDRGGWHVSNFVAEDVARHIVDLHNRSLRTEQ